MSFRRVLRLPDLFTRIEPNFNVGDTCLMWIGYRTADGYGRVGFHGKLRLTHRLALFLSGNMTPEQFEDKNTVVMHECDRPACINIAHLRIGTQQENVADRVRKGRSRKYGNKRAEAHNKEK